MKTVVAGNVPAEENTGETLLLLVGMTGIVFLVVIVVVCYYSFRHKRKKELEDA